MEMTMADSILNKLPASQRLRNGKRRLGEWLAMRRLLSQWADVVRTQVPSKLAAGRSFRKVVIIPADPWSLIGSKGDEAMMRAVIGRLSASCPGLEVAAVTASAKAEASARDLGVLPLAVWEKRFDLAVAWSAVEEFGADALLIVGADVMDGYYSHVTTSRFLAIGDLAARSGMTALVLGFSFNNNPKVKLKEIFDRTVPELKVNVRDQCSLDNFRRFSTRSASLVADAAFMLEPDAASQLVSEIAEWVADRRSVGDLIVGFNVHPMLFRHASQTQLQRLINSAAAAVDRVMQRHQISIVLISHDYRDLEGDAVCLAPLYDRLTTLYPERVHYPRAEMSANELKAVAGLMDGVVTGRMHLAIASLGMGVPVAALTYQDKFKGLFKHFELPEGYLLAPSVDGFEEPLFSMIEGFISNLPTLREVVRQHLPAVHAASLSNIQPILESSVVGADA